MPCREMSNSYRKRVNCSQDHSSAFKNCPAIKSHTKELFNIKKHKSFEQHITEKHNILTSTQTQYNEDIDKIKANHIKINQILTSNREQIDLLTEIIKKLEVNHTNEINKLTTQINEQTQINLELKNKIEEHDINNLHDAIESAEMQIVTLTADVSLDGKELYRLNAQQKVTTKQLKETTKHLNKYIKLTEQILPLTDPNNLVIFLGHIITNTSNTNTLNINIDTIKHIATQLTNINNSNEPPSTSNSNDGSNTEGDEGNASFNTRGVRYIKPS